MIMLTCLAAVAAVAAMPDAFPKATAPLPLQSEARAVMMRQLGSPPRGSSEVGLSAEEAGAVMKVYLESIGKKLEREEAAAPK